MVGGHIGHHRHHVHTTGLERDAAQARQQELLPSCEKHRAITRADDLREADKHLGLASCA